MSELTVKEATALLAAGMYASPPTEAQMKDGIERAESWLAAHDRQLKAEGWFEAIDYVSRHFEDYLPVGWSRRTNEDNPYRIESQETP